MSQSIAYIRVSSKGQNMDRQLEGMTFDRTFAEKISGATKNRPELSLCIEYLRAGDTLHIHSIDRLARSLRDLQEIIDALVAKQVIVKFHTERLTFGEREDPMSMLTLQLLGAFAQFERKLTQKRQREGIEVAKLKGIHLGRKPLDMTLATKAKELKSEGHNVISIAKLLNLSRPSIYKLLS
jgi:DNA invertase Pin-like site-specific DNA recombinase